MESTGFYLKGAVWFDVLHEFITRSAVTYFVCCTINHYWCTINHHFRTSVWSTFKSCSWHATGLLDWETGNSLCWEWALILNVPCISESCTEIKIKGLHKIFWGTTKKYENENLTYFFSFHPGLGRQAITHFRWSTTSQKSFIIIIITILKTFAQHIYLSLNINFAMWILLISRGLPFVYKMGQTSKKTAII